MHKAQRLINHVALVLDASLSMSGKQDAVVRVTDEQIKHLALRSEELSQETRVSVYRFGETTIECLIFDMDVMRLPSANDLYSVLRENTSLIDAILKSQEDLETTSQLYGDHAFLTFVMTDGEENRSRRSARELQRKIMDAPANWSMGFLVPDRRGREYMERLGVLADSVAIWDTSGVQGLNTVASSIRAATDNFMNARTKGVRGTRSVFGTGLDAVNVQTVSQTLTPLSGYSHLFVEDKVRIDEFVTERTGSYTKGQAYYQLVKTENIQPQKQVLVVDKKTGMVYGGSEARGLIGLGSTTVRVRPDVNPLYDVYVQSTSLNRNLVPGTTVLVRK